MNMIVATTQTCDECGKSVPNIKRVFKTKKFCSTCYGRIFKRSMCPNCHNFALLPKNDPHAICQKCQLDKPCARCGKINYEVGKITPYGPVCGHCATHYREPEPCEVCGTPSKRLTRVSRLGHDQRACPKCARADHKVCVACHRYRLLMPSADGRILCKTCLEKGEILCLSCSLPMPAGRGKQCEACYWSELLIRRLDIAVTAFAVPAMAAHFTSFGNWLSHQVGNNKAAITLQRYLPFFLDIEKQWKAIPEFLLLLKQFGTLRLRRALLPMRWMEETGIVVPDAAEKNKDSNLRRIDNTLNKLGKVSKERTILNGYYKSLMVDLTNGQTTICSIRLALSPAATLLLKGKEMSCIPPDQSVLNAFLEAIPGQRAAISGFVRYLRDKHAIEIGLPKADTVRALQNRRKKLETEMLLLMRDGDGGEAAMRKWISVALAYFHGLPRKAGRMLGDENIREEESGLVVMFKGKTYWVPLKI